MNNRLAVFHTGFAEIREPDVHYGRKNADFGQGFYLSDDESFSVRWAWEKAGSSTYINCYELDLTGLEVLRLERNEQWFRYIFRNRRGYEDMYGQYDVIMGPIANDTLYDTFGIMTSGLLTDEEALKLLLVGSEYTQIVIKSKKAARQLEFISSRIMDHEEIIGYRDQLKQEQASYQTAIALQLEKMS